MISKFRPVPIRQYSSIATPRYEMARRAAEIILEIIRGTGNRPKQRRIDLGFRLISRESTGKLSKFGGLANREITDNHVSRK